MQSAISENLRNDTYLFNFFLKRAESFGQMREQKAKTDHTIPSLFLNDAAKTNLLEKKVIEDELGLVFFDFAYNPKHFKMPTGLWRYTAKISFKLSSYCTRWRHDDRIFENRLWSDVLNNLSNRRTTSTYDTCGHED